jgi:tRNA pseudouridine55 synthase
MDGLLLVDKPAGPTSHDVVARMRRVLGERRAGHTGTLDPGATGLLPLVLGRATRLARFLSASDKTYEARIRLGFATDTGDAQGRPAGTPYVGPFPSRGAVDQALDAFRGTYVQEPPAFSAKRIGGQRSYKLARRARPASGPTYDAVRPPPVNVTVHALRLLEYEEDTVTLSVHCSGGFYVRSLAHDLGQRLGTAAHLAALRRIRVGVFHVVEAIGLADAERFPDRASAAIIPMARMLPDWSAVVLTEEGVQRALNGRDLRSADIRSSVGFEGRDAVNAARDPEGPESTFTRTFVRLIDEAGNLVGIAEPATTPGLLHPSVVVR